MITFSFFFLFILGAMLNEPVAAQPAVIESALGLRGRQNLAAGEQPVLLVDSVDPSRAEDADQRELRHREASEGERNDKQDLKAFKAERMEYAKLIRLLGSESYSERKAAMERLRDAGMAAVPDLELLRTHGDLEFRERIEILIRKIQEDDYRQHFQEFRLRRTADRAGYFPEWDRYAAVVGSDTNAIQNYIRIISSEPGLMSLATHDRRSLPVAIELRMNELAKEFHDGTGNRFPVESFSALLLLCSNEQLRLRGATSALLSSAFSDQRLLRVLEREPAGQQEVQLKEGGRTPTELLIGQWILRRGIAVERPLVFVMATRLPEGRELAQRIIRSGTKRPEMMLAMLVVAVFRNPEDVNLLESHFSNTAVLWPSRAEVRPAPKLQRERNEGAESRGQGYRVEIRDLALAVAIHLRGQEPETFGFRPDRVEATVFAGRSLGFPDDHARTAALENYRRAFP